MVLIFASTNAAPQDNKGWTQRLKELKAPMIWTACVDLPRDMDCFQLLIATPNWSTIFTPFVPFAVEPRPAPSRDLASELVGRPLCWYLRAKLVIIPYYTHEFFWWSLHSTAVPTIPGLSYSRNPTIHSISFIPSADPQQRYKSCKPWSKSTTCRLIWRKTGGTWILPSLGTSFLGTTHTNGIQWPTRYLPMGG